MLQKQLWWDPLQIQQPYMEYGIHNKIVLDHLKMERNYQRFLFFANNGYARYMEGTSVLPENGHFCRAFFW